MCRIFAPTLAAPREKVAELALASIELARELRLHVVQAQPRGLGDDLGSRGNPAAARDELLSFARKKEIDEEPRRLRVRRFRGDRHLAWRRDDRVDRAH